MRRKNIRLLIAEDEKETQRLLKAYFSAQQEIECCGCAEDGVRALQMIKQYKPDVLLLDIMMPHKDGLSVLRSLREQSNVKKPHIIITSAIGTVAMAQEAVALGAEYYFIKPYSVEDVLERIYRIGKNPVRTPLQMRRADVVRSLLALGVPTNFVGYGYTIDAVCCLLTSESVASLQKEVYRPVAEKNHTTVQCVENALHTVIARTYEANTPALQTVLHTAGQTAARRLTNAQFLTLLAEHIKMEEFC